MTQQPQESALVGDERGWPPAATDLSVADVGTQGWQLHTHLDTPIATIRGDRLEHNADRMARWCRDRDTELWPHAKTTMSAQLVAAQIRAGAQGFTVANTTQARLLLRWGARQVLIANQVVQPRAAQWFADEVSAGANLICYVDSTAGATILQDAAARAGVQLDVLLEVGSVGGRTGVRGSSDLAAVVAALSARPGLRLVGVAGYEGAFGGDRSRTTLSDVDSFLRRQVDVLEALVARDAVGVQRPIYSAGGSMYFDRVEAIRHRLSVDHRLVLRSGCYLLHDCGLFAGTSPLRGELVLDGLEAALTVWGTVHSRPEPSRAYLDVGRRDVGSDQGLPRPLSRVRAGALHAEELTGAEVTELNDQHLHLQLPPDSDVQVGDRIELGISHPCTTMDKWRTLALVDGDGVVTGAVTTSF